MAKTNRTPDQALLALLLHIVRSPELLKMLAPTPAFNEAALSVASQISALSEEDRRKLEIPTLEYSEAELLVQRQQHAISERHDEVLRYQKLWQMEHKAHNELLRRVQPLVDFINSKKED